MTTFDKDPNDPLVPIIRQLICEVDPDPNREGLANTPVRVAAAFRFWMQGYRQSPRSVLTTFQENVGDCNEMILISGIPVFSFCEHHMASFWGAAHVAYIPNTRVIGLSKVARLVEIFMRRLQIQERLTNQIADAMTEFLGPKGCGVTLQCRHSCMESRGVRVHGTLTTTSALRGCFHEASPRAEYLSRIPNTLSV